MFSLQLVSGEWDVGTAGRGAAVLGIRTLPPPTHWCQTWCFSKKRGVLGIPLWSEQGVGDIGGAPLGRTESHEADGGLARRMWGGV